MELEDQLVVLEGTPNVSQVNSRDKDIGEELGEIRMQLSSLERDEMANTIAKSFVERMHESIFMGVYMDVQRKFGIADDLTVRRHQLNKGIDFVFVTKEGRRITTVPYADLPKFFPDEYQNSLEKQASNARRIRTMNRIFMQWGFTVEFNGQKLGFAGKADEEIAKFGKPPVGGKKRRRWSDGNQSLAVKNGKRRSDERRGNSRDERRDEVSVRGHRSSFGRVRIHRNVNLRRPDVDKHSSRHDVMKRLRNQIGSACQLADLTDIGPAANADERTALDTIKLELTQLLDEISPSHSPQGSATESD
ncbi:unnamed protein product [Caenorhabditis auriculariae]|uniref:Uncharacterized protein n=1 Tax=Caenorhabditis auriculariae TaxID=2777116 RepID=A0A8S1GMA4_9PELO|nr:unnamed protein product [Caenorhabditis auriculariae]